LRDQSNKTDRFQQELSLIRDFDPRCAEAIELEVRYLEGLLEPREGFEQADVRGFEIKTLEGLRLATILVLVRPDAVVFFDIIVEAVPPEYR
jgi:hypothetical protein